MATTNAGGAKAPWLSQYTQALRHCHEVIIIPDRDKPGLTRAKTIARALKDHVQHLRCFELTNVKDITEWFQTGHSEVELVTLLDS